jgi:hypothetical protein
MSPRITPTTQASGTAAARLARFLAKNTMLATKPPIGKMRATMMLAISQPRPLPGGHALVVLERQRGRVRVLDSPTRVLAAQPTR